MSICNNNWMTTKNRVIRSKINKEIITVRCLHTESKKIRIYINIGKDICNLLNFKKDERVNLFVKKDNRNIFLIKKSFPSHDGHKLSFNPQSFFAHCAIVIPFENNIKISQTVTVDYDFEGNDKLLINITKLRWDR